jgi:hypothetical protein
MFAPLKSQPAELDGQYFRPFRMYSPFALSGGRAVTDWMRIGVIEARGAAG